MSEWNTVTPDLWKSVSLGEPYPWSVGPRAKTELSEILIDKEMKDIFTSEDTTVINRNLRPFLSPILTGTERSKAAQAALWIVRSWGGIKRGTDTEAKWSDALGDYSDERVMNFIQGHRNLRISSWSKLLAFAKPSGHAIYDARTAIALNCILDQLGDPRRFHAPASQNQKIKSASGILGNSKSNSRGYQEYLELLNSVVSQGHAADILGAEMVLFANGPLIAEQFCRQRERSALGGT